MVVLAVNGYDEPKELVQKFVKEKSLEQKILLMGGELARGKYAVTGFPTTFFVDPQGKIVDRSVGFADWLAASEEKKIQELLEKHKKKKEKTVGTPNRGSRKAGIRYSCLVSPIRSGGFG